MKTIIVGDIHGCLKELMLLLQKLRLQPEDRLVALGDIVDRGPDSLKVFQLLKDRPNTVVLMGNHERKHLVGRLSYAQEIVKLQFATAYPGFLEWLESLPYYLETEEAIVVHAGLEAGVPLSSQREEVLCGTTAGERHLAGKLGGGRSWDEFYPEDSKPVVVGHRVVGDVVKIRDRRIYWLDTGACHGGRLSALVLPAFEVVQVDATADHWSEQMQLWQLPVLKSLDWLHMDYQRMRRSLDRASVGGRQSEVTRLIAAMQSWLDRVPVFMTQLEEALHNKAGELLQTHGESGFGKEAARHTCSSLLFAAKSGGLSSKSIEKAANTPLTLIHLASSLALAIEFPL